MATTYTLRPAHLEDFAEPRNRLHILERRYWAIISAENPSGKVLNAHDNWYRTGCLAADLDAAGFRYLFAEGQYGGDPETSLIVLGIHTERALELARKYGQESILTRHGLIKSNGETLAEAIGVVLYDDQPEDDFTHVSGFPGYFTIQLDW